MILKCSDLRQKLDAFRRDIETYRQEINEYARTGDVRKMNQLALGKLVIQEEIKRFREKIETTNYQEAKNLFGEGFFFGYDDALELFDAEVPQQDEPVPFSRAELVEAKNRGMILMYRPSKTRSGELYDIEGLLIKFRNRRNKAAHRHFGDDEAESLRTKAVEYLDEANKRWLRRDRLSNGWSLIDTSSADETVTPFSDDRFKSLFSGFDGLKRTALEKDDNPNVFIPRTADVVYDLIVSRYVFGTIMNKGRFLTWEKEVDQRGLISGYDAISIFDDSNGELDAELNLAKKNEKVRVYLSMNRRR